MHLCNMGRGITAKARREERDLTDAEIKEIDGWLDEADEIRGAQSAGEIGERLDAIDEWGAELQPRLTNPADPQLTSNFGIGGSFTAPRPITGRDRSYAAMFPDERLSIDGWSSPAEFMRTIGLHQGDQRLRQASLGESLPSSGGFSVPSILAAEWLDGSLESELIRPRAQLYAMSSASLTVPGWDMSDNSSTLYGGFSREWLAENAEATDSDPKMRSLMLNAKKCALFTKASNELLADGPNFESRLGDAMRAAVSFSLDDAFISGTGAGQPLGILNASSLITQDKEDGQAASSIVYENLAKMYSRLAPECVGNSIWIAHNSAIPQLLTLAIDVGTAGSHIPVMSESDGKFRMLTRPCFFTEKTPTLGSVGDIMLVDPTQYIVGLRKEMSLDSSMHVGWQNDQTAFRCIVRADGMPSWASARTPLNGADVSWAVALEAR